MEQSDRIESQQILFLNFSPKMATKAEQNFWSWKIKCLWQNRVPVKPWFGTFFMNVSLLYNNSL